MNATYIDYRGPAIAAGAIQRSNGSWVLPNGAIEHNALNALDCLQATPVPVPAPKARTFAAIQREAQSRGLRRIIAPGMAIRALQYAEWLKGREAPHSACVTSDPRAITSDPRAVTFDHAADGSKRVRNVYLDSGMIEIPHWDWVPTVEDLSAGLFE